MIAEAVIFGAVVVGGFYLLFGWAFPAWDRARDALRRRTARRARIEMQRRRTAAVQAEICRVARAKGALR